MVNTEDVALTLEAAENDLCNPCIDDGRKHEIIGELLDCCNDLLDVVKRLWHTDDGVPVTDGQKVYPIIQPQSGEFDVVEATCCGGGVRYTYGPNGELRDAPQRSCFSTRSAAWAEVERRQAE